MLLTYRHRRGVNPITGEYAARPMLKRMIFLAAAAVLLYFVGAWVLKQFGVGNPLEQRSGILHLENRGAVTVSIDGELMQRAQDGMKMYSGDRLASGPGTAAALQFFEGSVVRIGGESELLIQESAQGEKSSKVHLALNAGTLWISTPKTAAAGVPIDRRLSTAFLTLTVSSETELSLSQRSLAIFDSAGQGVEVEINATGETFLVGEGQEWNGPEGEFSGDPYAMRSALRSVPVRDAFATASRRIRDRLMANVPAQNAPEAPTAVLTIERPLEGEEIRAATVTVTGRFGNGVESVRINGTIALMNGDAGTFTQDIAASDGGETMLTVEALDGRGAVVAAVRRTITRGASSVPSPTITAPGKDGTTVRTQEEETVLRGTVPEGTTAVLVNDYQLRLFTPGKTTWSYVASRDIGNFKEGPNVFTVVALIGDERSAPALITVILGPEAPATAPPTPTALPSNAPLTPGILTVTAPTSGTSHVASGTGFLLEGDTSAQTASVWVNDYRLQLYVSGKTFWNYIASSELKTLKPGTNVYTIVARNAAGEILDRMEYTVEYSP